MHVALLQGVGSDHIHVLVALSLDFTAQRTSMSIGMIHTIYIQRPIRHCPFVYHMSNSLNLSSAELAFDIDNSVALD